MRVVPRLLLLAVILEACSVRDPLEPSTDSGVDASARPDAASSGSRNDEGGNSRGGAGGNSSSDSSGGNAGQEDGSGGNAGREDGSGGNAGAVAGSGGSAGKADAAGGNAGRADASGGGGADGGLDGRAGSAGLPEGGFGPSDGDSIDWWGWQDRLDVFICPPPPPPPDAGSSWFCNAERAWRWQRPPCGAARCGNGTLDYCPNHCGNEVTEVCDGMELRGDTCLGLGYSGGTLTCSSACGLDTSACTRCAPLDTSLLWCGNAPVDDVAPWTIALDATETEVALAWVSLDASGDVKLHFARFSPDLSLIDQKTLASPACPRELSLAARPGGWSLAVQSGDGLHLLALDESGVQTATLQVFAGSDPSTSILAARPAAEPLLVWIPPSLSDDSLLRAALVNPGGASLTAAATIAFPFPLVAGHFSVTAIADGWLVATRAGDSSATDTIYIAPLATNGALAGPFQTPFGPDVDNPRLTASGNEVRMTFGKFENAIGGVSFSRLTPAGTALGSRALIGPWPTYSGEAPLVAVGADTFVLLPTYTGNTGETERLDVVRVNESGAHVYAPRTIVGDPRRIHSHAVARRGSDVILAWINGVPGAPDSRGMAPAGIGLARVVP